MHEFGFKNLRNPARDRCAGLMRQFCPNQVSSTLAEWVGMAFWSFTKLKKKKKKIKPYNLFIMDSTTRG
jgi:hypothetical protein